MFTFLKVYYWIVQVTKRIDFGNVSSKNLKLLRFVKQSTDSHTYSLYNFNWMSYNIVLKKVKQQINEFIHELMLLAKK